MVVEISGRVAQKVNRFIRLRDEYGIIQLVSPMENPQMDQRFQGIPINSHIVVLGRLCPRPRTHRRSDFTCTDVEIKVLDILHVQAPFSNPKPNQVGEPSRELTAIEFSKCKGEEKLMNAFRNRRRTCGELRSQNIGEKVELIGWVDENKRHMRFMNLHDGHGYVQIVLDCTNAELAGSFMKLRESDLVWVEGLITGRPANNCNPNMATGEIELNMCGFKMLADYVAQATPAEIPLPVPSPSQTTVAPPVAETITPNKQTSHQGEPERGFRTTARCFVTPVANFHTQQQQRQYSQQTRAQVPPQNLNLFTNRSHTCGELRVEHIGQRVKLVGWLEFERMKKFLTLRDGYGSIQVLIPPSMTDEVKIDEVPFESIIEVDGTVVARPDKFENASMVTGNVEVIMTDFKVLNTSRKNLPVEVRDFNRPKETLRLEHRYVDLRYADMQRNLRTRSSVLMKMREYLINECGFVEVETPTLFRKTPGVITGSSKGGRK